GVVEYSKAVEDFLEPNNNYAAIAETDGGAVGYAIWALDQKGGTMVLCHVAVIKEWQRKKIGTALVNRLKKQCPRYAKLKCAAIVNDTELTTHLFLRANHFRCVKVLRNQPKEDRYVFHWRHEMEGPEQPNSGIVSDHVVS